jgi:hypothetical protein
VKKQHTDFIWRSLVSRNKMRWRIEKSIWLIWFIWFAPLENLDNNADITKAWETVRENIKISSKNRSLGFMTLRDISHGSLQGAEICYMIGNKPNCFS